MLRVKNYFLEKSPAWIHYWELLLAMTEREIKARYKYAVLGFLWIILNPILQMITIGTVFSFVFKTAIADYFLFLFSGLLVWNYFSMSLLKTTPGIVFELSLIEKAKFPREVIVLSIILSNLFHTLIGFGLFVGVLIVMGKITFWKLVFLPVLLVWTTALLAGLSLFCSALNVKYRDVNFFVQAFVQLLFYATPIVYSITALPIRFQNILELNPLTSMLELYQWVLLNKTFPNPSSILISILITLIALLIGVIVFKKEALFFDDWI